MSEGPSYWMPKLREVYEANGLTDEQREDEWRRDWLKLCEEKKKRWMGTDEMYETCAIRVFERLGGKR